MKLTFESNLNYQQDAIKSITDLFEGQPLEDSILEFNLKEEGTLNLINGVSNNLILSEEQILTNLQTIQANNEIKISDKLDSMHFSVEMETGTGKPMCICVPFTNSINCMVLKVCDCCSFGGYS